MNHSFYEENAKEKIRDLLKEGQRSQAFYRSGAPRISFLGNIPKLVLLLLGILGLLMVFLH
jgi:hypothetical protein